MQDWHFSAQVLSLHAFKPDGDGLLLILRLENVDSHPRVGTQVNSLLGQILVNVIQVECIRYLPINKIIFPVVQ